MHKRLFCTLVSLLLLFTLLPAGALAFANENLVDKESKTSDSGAQASSLDPQTTDTLDLPHPIETLAAKANATPLSPGKYIIRSALSNTRVIEISQGSKSASAKVQLYSSNMTQAQLFEFKYDSKGFYAIKNMRSQLVLAVSKGQKKSGTAVVQRKANGRLAQKWILTKLSNGSYRIESALKKNLVIGVAGAKDKNGSAIKVYNKNNGRAQSFVLIPQTTKVASERTIANGRYTITSSLASSLVLDIADASSAKGARLQLWESNKTGAQVFDIQYRSDGFYSIRPLCSGLLLSASNNNVVASTPIIQWSSTGEQGQRFAIQKNENGSYTFLSKKTGLALSVSGSTAKNGAKIQLWYPNATKAQMFKIKAAGSDPITIKEGIVSIIPVAKKDKRVDIAGASRKSGANAQVFKANDTLAQKFLIKRIAAQTYTFQCLNSGYYLSATNGDVRQKAAPRSGLVKSQKWRAEWAYGGFSLINMATGKAMTLTSGGQDGHTIKMSTQKNIKTQAFFLQRTAALSSGTYLISTVGGKVIDSKNGGVKAGTNTQVWQSNGTAAQKWQLKAADGGHFSIRCVRSGRVLDIKNSSTAHGANVRLWNYKGSSGQLWKVVPSKDGWFYIQAKNGSYLSVAGGGKKNGQNVRASKTPQKFRFDLTTYAGGSQILSSISSARGSKSITSFGGYSPSGRTMGDLQKSLSSIRAKGYAAGFMMVDLTTGQGIAYNVDQSFYSASTVKGPYVASIVSAKPSSVLAWKSTMQATIRHSSNEGYESLRTAFGSSPMQQWCDSAGVPTSVGSNWYTDYSTRTLTKLWLQNYTFFTSEKQNSKLCQSWYTSSFNSPIYATLGKYHYMNTKAGWIGEADLRAASDAGIVWGDGGPYLITIMTNAPGNINILKPLIWSIERAHDEMI
jgi:hypothetical protein